MQLAEPQIVKSRNRYSIDLKSRELRFGKDTGATLNRAKSSWGFRFKTKARTGIVFSSGLRWESEGIKGRAAYETK